MIDAEIRVRDARGDSRGNNGREVRGGFCLRPGGGRQLESEGEGRAEGEGEGRGEAR
jgi:hypothetical protein